MAKIKHIAIFTEDPDKLATFYEEVFGMKVTGKTGRGAVWITDGYMDVALLWKRAEMKIAKGINHFGFTLDKAEKPEIYQKLKARGIDIFQPGQDRPYVEDAAKDPDGNRFDMTTGMRDIDEEMARPRTEAEMKRLSTAEVV
jgi:catechol 2,3-dioxygenase-like lactoylglutathione lyase family enzyme